MPMKKKNVLLILLMTLIAASLFCQEKTESSEKKTVELPQWALYARRAEIVTFGSLPFTTMGVSFAFSTYKYFSGASSTFPNPFDKSSSSYSEGDILKILGISLSISAVIGIADLIVGIVRHNGEAKRLERLNESNVITIVPATDEEIEKFKLMQGASDSAPQASAVTED